MKNNAGPMDLVEQRQVLESIARDEKAYPRDRIAAVRALQEMAKRAGEAMDAELEQMLAGK